MIHVPDIIHIPEKNKTILTIYFSLSPQIYVKRQKK